MKSPFTGSSVTLKTGNMEITFRKEIFKVVSQYYVCNDTGEEFTTPEQDDLTINQAYNQYKEKYGIPFIDEINAILDKYDISALKMSKILGFGDNQYLKYTKGEIPSVSNGRMISMIADVNEFRKMLKTASNEFSAEEIEKIEKKISTIKEPEKSPVEMLLFGNKEQERSIYGGYVKPQIDKIRNIVLFFLNKNNGVFETKLNKLLFYTDFLCFKESGIGMSGLRYKAIQFGPVPLKYSTTYENVGGTEFQTELFSNGNAGKKIIGTEEFDSSVFSEFELSILEKVQEKFQYFDTAQISKESHNEDAWLENIETRSIIRYDYAFSLRAI